jgi:hypothetical protein
MSFIWPEFSLPLIKPCRYNATSGARRVKIAVNVGGADLRPSPSIVGQQLSHSLFCDGLGVDGIYDVGVGDDISLPRNDNQRIVEKPKNCTVQDFMTLCDLMPLSRLSGS